MYDVTKIHDVPHDSDAALNNSITTQTNICFLTPPFPVRGVVRIRLLQNTTFTNILVTNAV